MILLEVPPRLAHPLRLGLLAGVAVALGLLLSCSSEAPEPASQPPLPAYSEQDLSESSIGLEIGPGLGREPWFTLAVSRGGAVYEGRSRVPRIGREAWTLPEDRYRELVHGFLRLDFQSLPARYGFSANDLETIVLEFTWQGETHAVELYWPGGSIESWGGPVSAAEESLWPAAHALHVLVQEVLDGTGATRFAGTR